MPFGFVGTLGTLVGVCVLVPLGYAFVWPRGVPRISAFLLITVIVGVALGAIGFYWFTGPLQGAGISGQAQPGAIDARAFAELMNRRFLVALVLLPLLQAMFCRVIDQRTLR